MKKGVLFVERASKTEEVAYFGVTKEVDLLSYNGFWLLQEVFSVLSLGTVWVCAHLSTPCSAGCGLRHLRFRKGGKALEKWRAALAIHKRSWRRIGDPRGLCRITAPPVISRVAREVWFVGETIYKAVSKKLGRNHGCLGDRCCFEKGQERPWKRGGL